MKKIIRTIVKSRIIEVILWIIFVLGLIFIILTTELCPITPFGDPNMCSKPLITGIIGGFLNIIGIILMLISIILILMIYVKRRGIKKNDV